MSKEHESKLQEIEGKILKEESVLNGFKTMMSAHSKRGLRTQCEDGILQSEKILSFFRSERDKIKLLLSQSLSRESNSSRGLDSFGSLSIRSENNKLVQVKPSALDFRKYNPPLSREMIAFRVHEIQHKLAVEEKVLEAVNKYHTTTLLSKENSSKDSQEQVRQKVFDSTEKARIYTLALRELKPLVLEAVSLSSEQPKDNLTIKPGIRQPLSGRLSIKILAEQNIAYSDGSELSIVLQVDGVAKGTPFRLPNGDRRYDHFTVDVERANEMELLVLSHGHEHSNLVAMMWIPLGEISDDIRRRTALNPGWAPADSQGVIHSSNDPRSSLSSSYDIDVIEDWFKLEPTGKLLLRIKFTRDIAKARTNSRLGRQGAVRKARHQIVSTHLGHQFEHRQVYRPHICPVCRKFAINATELQCQDCRFFCHAACASKVRAKCITRSDKEGNKRRSLNQFYNIPHRFEGSLGLAAYWCCHCGQMLSVLGGNGKRCLDCDLACHINCRHLVPNFCGMTGEMASQLLGFDHESAHAVSPKETALPISNLPPAKEFAVPTVEITPVEPSGGAIKEFTSASDDMPIFDNPKRNSRIIKPLPSIKKPSPVAVPSLSDYKLLSVLGRGNFGKVLLAQDRKSKNTLAIKVLKKDVALANDEVDALSNEKKVFVLSTQSKNPFLVKLYACFQTPESIVFVMDYVSGGDLMSLIQRRRSFSPNQVRFYAVEVILALEYLHSQDIVYRDLKLDNILLDQSGHIKVADYGLCKGNMPYGSITSTFCGTPEFMAPEILEDQKYGRAVDWWALGVLVYQMVLGQSPFKGADDTEIFEAILEDELLFPPTLPRATVSILQKLLTRDPSIRLGGGPEDAAEVKAHPYFHGIDWQAHLECQIPPPYVPRVRDPTDVANFDKEFTSLPPTITPSGSVLKPSQQALFADFAFTAE